MRKLKDTEMEKLKLARKAERERVAKLRKSREMIIFQCLHAYCDDCSVVA
jgi:cell division protein FtsB